MTDASSLGPRYRPAPRFESLGEGFADVVEPARFPLHRLRFRNDRAAATVGLDGLDDAAWERHFAKLEPLPENLRAPLALRYHGHQFGVYNPGLGDGRGFLFAQLLDDRERLLDLGTKGSGRTPWSRGGDGRLTLQGAVREILAAEQLEALGVPTSRAFSVFETGEELLRSDEPSPTRSAVLVRLSFSHVRFGTFQRLAYGGDVQGAQKLVDYCLRELYPAVAPGGDPARALFDAVTASTVDLTAAWMVAGFVHGVLNSDNMSITGESFDYGPWRFLPQLDPRFTAAYFDDVGYYAYGRQPGAALTNLLLLARALGGLGLTVDEQALAAAMNARFEIALGQCIVRRLGLRPRGDAEDAHLADAVFSLLADPRVGFARFFFDWFGGEAALDRVNRSPQVAAYDGPEGETFRRSLAPYAPAHETVPSYFDDAEPCDLLIDEVRALWAAIDERDDWEPLARKVAAIRRMGRALAGESDGHGDGGAEPGFRVR